MLRIHFNDYIGAHIENSLLDKQCTILTKDVVIEEDVIESNAWDYNGTPIKRQQFQSNFLNDYDVKPRQVKEEEVEKFTDYLLPFLQDHQIVKMSTITEKYDYDSILDGIHTLIERQDFFNGFHFNHISSDFNYDKLLVKLLDEEYSNSSVNVFTNNDVFQQFNVLRDYKTSLIVMDSEQINESQTISDYSNFSAGALYSLPLTSTMMNSSPKDIVQVMQGMSNILFKTKLDTIDQEMNYSGIVSQKIHKTMPFDTKDIPVTVAFPYWFSNYKVGHICRLTKDSGLGVFAQSQLKKLDSDLREHAYDTMDYYHISTGSDEE